MVPVVGRRAARLRTTSLGDTPSHSRGELAPTELAYGRDLTALSSHEASIREMRAAVRRLLGHALATGVFFRTAHELP